MSAESIGVLTLLLAAVILFVSGQIRIDLVALLVVSALAVSGIVTPGEALSGFSNPAVITIWSMFVLSAALARTNVANIIGKSMLKISGSSETKILLILMLVSGLLSFIMNNIGVAALLLPVVMSLSKSTSISPSRLLMPMVFGVLLGGITTLLTTVNLIVSDSLRSAGLNSFGLFDFLPVGGPVFIAGVLFIVLVGKYFLPKKDKVKDILGSEAELRKQYALQERTCVMRIPLNSYLNGKTIAEANLGSAAGLTVLAIIRNGNTQLAPDPSEVLRADDKLMIGGALERFNEFRGWQKLIAAEEHSGIDKIISDEFEIVEISIPPKSELIDHALHEINFRKKFCVNVLAVDRSGEIKHSNLHSFVLKEKDILLVQGSKEKLNILKVKSDFNLFKKINPVELITKYNLEERVFTVSVPENSELINKSLSKSRMGASFGVRVLALIRENKTVVMPDPEETIHLNDKLVISGKKDDLDILRGLQELELVDEDKKLSIPLESEQVGLIEATLSPRSNLAGKSLRQIHFRGKYGLQVIALWREGRAYRTNLRDFELKFGDALLILGKRDKIKILTSDPDFIVLTHGLPDIPLSGKAPLAALIMAAVLIPVMIGIIPISIAALGGAALMVLTGCLSMDEMYKSIDWKSVFVIAGMFPLSIAMQSTGTTEIIAEQVIKYAGQFGSWGIVIGIYLFITAAASVIPTSALVVMMAPLTLSIAANTGISPQSLMMTLAVSSSASFISPISHPANILIMGPGGYRFSDYVKLGLPLTIVIGVIAVLLISVFWKF
ncbi:MAG: anion permease [Ignavibacteriales bacterium]|nr:MAG: anion permease [Ignavibacteriales bacterium]